MRRSAAAGVLPLVVLPVLCQAAPAAAAEETTRAVTADAAAWSWRRIAPAGSPVTEPSNVPAGDLAVSFDGRPDAPPAKATYLRLALGDLPTGTQVRSLRLTVPVDTAVQQDPSTAPVVACRLKAAFTAGEGTDPEAMPAEDCAQPAKGVYDAASASYSFLLTDYALDWASGVPSFGVVLRPDPAAALPTVLPFDVVLKGKAAVTGALTAVLPAPVAVVDPVPEQPPVVTPPVVAPPPVVGGVLPPPVLPPRPQPAPQVVVPPQPVTQPVASTVRQAQMRAPLRASAAGFAAAGALAVLLLALAGWSLGETTDPRWFARHERLRRDRLVRGAVVVPVIAPAVPARRAVRLVQPQHTRQGRRPRSTASSTVTYS